MLFFFLLWRCDPTRFMASSFLRFSRSHTTTHYSRQDSSGRVISPSQRLPDNTRHSQQTNIHFPRWDSDPRSQQVSGRRPTPQTARLLGPAINPLKPELNPICYLLALLGAHHFLHVSRIRVKSLTIRLLMSYIYMEHLFLMFLDHTRRRHDDFSR